MGFTLFRWQLLVVLSVSVVGCSVRPVTPPVPPPVPSNAPFFASNPQDGKLRQSFRQKADQLLATCPAVHPCERAHFLRGMVALYDDRELAATHFKSAAASAPNSSAGASSIAWLQLLKDSDYDIASPSFGQATERLVQELIEQELARRQESHEPTGSAEIATLKQELKVRDKQLDELTKQLEALKQIDREMRDKTLQTRPPSKTPPAGKPNESP
jgi:hypothetical protein